MGSPRYERALELVAELVAAGVPATIDPAELVGRLYGDDATSAAVLVPPPRLDYAGAAYGSVVASWRLVLVASPGAGVVRAWETLDALLEGLAGEYAIELAEPTSYALPDAAEPAPAYAVTITESVGSEP